MPGDYALALNLACGTVARCLQEAPLSDRDRVRLHAALQEVQGGWTHLETLCAPMTALSEALAALPDDRAVPARVALQTIQQWHREVTERPRLVPPPAAALAGPLS